MSSMQSERAGRKSLWSGVLSVPATHERLFADKVFTWNDWALHRSAAWRHRIEPVVFARVAAGFVWQLLLVTFVSVLVCLYHTLLVPLGAPPVPPQLNSPFNMITFALSLLLVFKTNSSYSRWWEGRIIWGQVVNYGRNLPRMLLAFAPPSEDCSQAQRDALHAAARWIAASAHIMRGHIREATCDRCEEEAAHLLLPEEREYLREGWRNKPLGVAYVLSWLCSHPVFEMDAQKQVALQNEVSLFTNMFGGCERIQKTPIPSAYARHTSRFLMIYVTFSPLLLWPSMGWATPVVAPVIAFLLLGVENVGVQIEEPFRVLPLEAICRGIEMGVQDMAAAALHGDVPSVSLNPLVPRRLSTVLRPAPRQVDASMGDRRPSLAAVLQLDHHPEFQTRQQRNAGVRVKTPLAGAVDNAAYEHDSNGTPTSPL